MFYQISGYFIAGSSWQTKLTSTVFLSPNKTYVCSIILCHLFSEEPSSQSCRQLCCIQTYVASMAMVLRLWPMYRQHLGHRELVRKKYKFFPPRPHPHRPRESESMYVGPSYLCFQKFSRRCFCKLYFEKLWYKGHIFISIKNMCIYMWT